MQSISGDLAITLSNDLSIELYRVAQGLRVLDLLGSELGDLVQLANVQGNAVGLAFTMCLDKLIQPILSPTNCSDLDAFLDQFISQAFSNSRRGSDEKYVLVGECHSFC